MTFPEWVAQVTGFLEGAGFTVEQYYGFPLVKIPATHDDTVRLLELRVNPPCDKRIYAEGMLFVPAGSAERLAAEP